MHASALKYQRLINWNGFLKNHYDCFPSSTAYITDYIQASSYVRYAYILWRIPRYVRIDKIHSRQYTTAATRTVKDSRTPTVGHNDTGETSSVCWQWWGDCRVLIYYSTRSREMEDGSRRGRVLAAVCLCVCISAQCLKNRCSYH